MLSLAKNNKPQKGTPTVPESYKILFFVLDFFFLNSDPWEENNNLFRIYFGGLIA
jgi:hypothetical protein